jgi:hypothetical protein
MAWGSDSILGWRRRATRLYLGRWRPSLFSFTGCVSDIRLSVDCRNRDLRRPRDGEAACDGTTAASQRQEGTSNSASRNPSFTLIWELPNGQQRNVRKRPNPTNSGHERERERERERGSAHDLRLEKESANGIVPRCRQESHLCLARVMAWPQAPLNRSLLHEASHPLSHFCRPRTPPFVLPPYQEDSVD